MQKNLNLTRDLESRESRAGFKTSRVNLFGKIIRTRFLSLFKINIKTGRDLISHHVTFDVNINPSKYDRIKTNKHPRNERPRRGGGKTSLIGLEMNCILEERGGFYMTG